MSEKIEVNKTDFEATSHRTTELRRMTKVMFGRWVVIVSTVIIGVFILLAIFAPLIAPYNPLKQNLRQTLVQPSTEHLLGTDVVGRDELSRIIYGSRISLLVGIIVAGIASCVGTFLGLIAGYFGKISNNIIMRIMDAMMSIPGIVLALAIGAALGGGLRNVMISLGIALIPGYCRLMCAQVLSIKESDYMQASRSIGVGNVRNLIIHIFPNAFPPLLVLVTFNLGSAILAEAGLSFLGIGISPPEAAWGSMVNDGYKYLMSNPLLSIAPGVAIILLVVAFNILGDGLRDALDPKLRGIL